MKFKRTRKYIFPLKFAIQSYFFYYHVVSLSNMHLECSGVRCILHMQNAVVGERNAVLRLLILKFEIHNDFKQADISWPFI